MPQLAELTYLAENLRGFRKRHDLSQEELAHLCKVHRTYLGAIERAERNLTVKTLSSISAATGIPASDLIRKRRIR